MITVPLRVRIQAGVDGPSCDFTVRLSLCVPPTKGDHIILPDRGMSPLVVAGLYHFVAIGEEPAFLCVVTPVLAESYDAMLRTLDWFKANFEVEDFAAEDEPVTYYRFYRNLVHVLGLTGQSAPLVGYDPNQIRVFGEACRAVILAEMEPEAGVFDMALVGLNPTVEHLHKLVLERRVAEPDGADMLAVVKEWEGRSNQKQVMSWRASVDACLRSAKLVFGRWKTIPIDYLPSTIKGQV